MHLTRRSRMLTALLALISLLFMQWALAAHPCHAGQPALNSVMSQAKAMAMPDCGMTSSEKTSSTDVSLCHEHCAQGKQSLDRTPAPDVTPFIPVLLVQCSLQYVSTSSPIPKHYPDVSLADREAPSLAIRHCCFRI